MGFMFYVSEYFHLQTREDESKVGVVPKLS